MKWNNTAWEGCCKTKQKMTGQKTRPVFGGRVISYHWVSTSQKTCLPHPSCWTLPFSIPSLGAPQGLGALVSRRAPGGAQAPQATQQGRRPQPRCPGRRRAPGTPRSYPRGMGAELPSLCLSSGVAWENKTCRKLNSSPSKTNGGGRAVWLLICQWSGLQLQVITLKWK